MASNDIRKALDSFDVGDIDSSTKDFIVSWERTMPELTAVLKAARILRFMREGGLSTRIWTDGLALSNFIDASHRTRFSFAAACSMLGLGDKELAGSKADMPYGEPRKEAVFAATLLSELVGIRDALRLGEGDQYQRSVARALDEAYGKGNAARPSVINLQSGIDHPAQALSDLLHAAEYVGGIDALRGKTLTISWAYSPSMIQPLSVPQGFAALASRFGMQVRLAHPSGYDLMPDIETIAKSAAKNSGGSFQTFDSMEEAFEGADIVYPKYWTPYDVLLQRVPFIHAGDTQSIAELDLVCASNASLYKNWECSDDMMRRTNDALYMHSLPVDISGVSCRRGEVTASVFERYRAAAYREASYRPYIMAAMMLVCRFGNPLPVLRAAFERKRRRVL